MFEIKGKYTTAKVMIDDVEESCVAQIVQMVNHPAFTKPIAIMPDTHAGKGSVIGFTMELNDKIIPNVVGVDIGCGMVSAPFKVETETIFATEERMKLFNKAVRLGVPFGTDTRSTVSKVGFRWNEVNTVLTRFATEFKSRTGLPVLPVVMSDGAFEKMCDRIAVKHDRVMKSIGTLGGGNHFIEVGKSVTDGRYWITIHSGSRNFGKCVAEYWQKRAVAAMTDTISKHEYVEMIKMNFPKKDWGHMIAAFTEEKKATGVPKGMEYLTGVDMYGYMVDMLIAQEYAEINREAILTEINKFADIDWSQMIETTHNFVDFDDWIIRKGAIRSYHGELSIIPFNMRDGLLITMGRDNMEWNCSAPHGAGRVLSRSQAKATLNTQDAKEQMKGIWTSCIPIDEAPGAYKDSVIIEAAIEPTAYIVDRIKPVMNFKGEE